MKTELALSISYKIACAPREDSDQSFRPQPVGALDPWLSTGCQTDLSIRWAHMQDYRKFCVLAQFILLFSFKPPEQ